MKELEIIPQADKLQLMAHGTVTYDASTIQSSGYAWLAYKEVKTVRHGLGFNPIMLIYLGDQASGQVFQATALGISQGFTYTKYNYVLDAYADETNLYLDFYSWTNLYGEAYLANFVFSYYLLSFTN